nr:Integrase, catalytic core [Ipomoea batatas]
MNSDKVPKVAVAVFILKGEKVLVGQRLAGAGTSCFSVPSGHLEFELGDDKANKVTPKTSDESSEEIERAHQDKVTRGITEGQSGHLDGMSPYLLHASDTPGQIYVTELLRDGNYGEWVNDMRDALFAKNKIGFVDGSIPMPKPNSPYLQQWMRCNAMVKGWLKSAMDKDMRSSVRYANTARDIWEDLEERFGKGSAPRAFEIRRSVVLLKQEKASVSSYYAKLKSLWDEMMAISPLPRCVCSGCTCNISKQLVHMKEKEQLYDFLMGLGEEFSTVKSQILSAKPTPSLGHAYHMVSEDEQHRQISAAHKPMVEAAAFQMQKGRIDRPICGHCQKTGHTEDQCYEIIGYPANWRKGPRDKKGWQHVHQKVAPKAAQVNTDMNLLQGLTQAQLTKLAQLLNTDEDKLRPVETMEKSSCNMAGKINGKNLWVIDSGATDHIFCDDSLLNNVESKYGEFPVTIPNGDKVAVSSIGGTKLPNGMQISRVLNIPDFQCNLVSVGRLTKDFDCALTFFSDFCIMQDLPSRKLIGVGRMHGGLYYMEPAYREGMAMSVKSKDSSIWHRRLGHASRYPHGQKGYRVYDPNEQVFHTTRDLIFFEDKFPYKNHVLESEPQIQKPYSQSVDDETEDTMNTVQAQEVDNNRRTEPCMPAVEMDCGEISEIIVDGTNVEDRGSIEPSGVVHEMVQRRSQRERRMPKYLENYETTLLPSISPSTPTTPSASSTCCFHQCAAREVMEEAGLELKNIETLKVINHVFHNEAKPSHYVVLLIRAELSDPDQIPENVEPDRCESWDWYEWNHMPKPLTPPLQLILKSGFNPFSANVQN